MILGQAVDDAPPAAADVGCWSLAAVLPRTLVISSSTHGVHFGPAAVPSLMHSPSRTASRAEIRVKLHQPP